MSEVSRIVDHLTVYPAWHDGSACGQIGPELADTWFPEKGERSTLGVRVCQGCPVRRECLEYALENPLLRGIWGGMTYPQRRELLKQRKREAA